MAENRMALSHGRSAAGLFLRNRQIAKKETEFLYAITSVLFVKTVKMD